MAVAWLVTSSWLSVGRSGRWWLCGSWWLVVIVSGWLVAGW
ncbi:hypothetical protein ACXZ9C_11125 [Streptococcus agalactiae]